MPEAEHPVLVENTPSAWKFSNCLPLPLFRYKRSGHDIWA